MAPKHQQRHLCTTQFINRELLRPAERFEKTSCKARSIRPACRDRQAKNAEEHGQYSHHLILFPVEFQKVGPFAFQYLVSFSQYRMEPLPSVPFGWISLSCNPRAVASK